MIILSGLGLWMRASVLRGLIQSEIQVTYRGNTRSRVEILVTNEDNRCLGKCNLDRVSKDRVGTV